MVGGGWWVVGCGWWVVGGGWCAVGAGRKSKGEGVGNRGRSEDRHSAHIMRYLQPAVRSVRVHRRTGAGWDIGPCERKGFVHCYVRCRV